MTVWLILWQNGFRPEIDKRITHFTMTIDQILIKCNYLTVDEKRINSPVYDERVIFQKDLGQWMAVLSEMLGPPVKPAGQKTTRQEFSMTVEYGGIADNQVMFYKKFDDNKVIVMLWPWKDNARITLKIIAIPN